MPIRPENKSKYPKNWKQIRKDILERAENKCEFCGLANYAYVYRTSTSKAIKIILTIAHLDQDPTNNNYNNLRALCQKCHNTLDAPFRAEHRKENKNKNIKNV